MKTPQIEITTLADIPAGTGLGSSGAFTVSALKAVQIYDSVFSTNESIAELACKIEIDRLREPVGKQDQYASAIGGLCEYYFHKDDTVEYKKLPIYKSFKQSGPNHNPIFKALVCIPESKKFAGYGKSKKIAEQNAAKSLVDDLNLN